MSTDIVRQMTDLAEPITSLLSDLSRLGPDQLGEKVRELASLFESAAEDYLPEQVDVFDHVLSRLIELIDDELRVLLSATLAPIANAPRRSVENLAGNEDIAIAGPLLAQSRVLGDDFLAQTKGQAHLKAISGREHVGCRVCDVLVNRGNQDVLFTLTKNPGVTFSQEGYLQVAERASDCDELVRILCNRPDVSRQQIVLLFEKASEAVRRELEVEESGKNLKIAAAIDMAKRRIQERTLVGSEAYAQARSRIDELQGRQVLDRGSVLHFAQRGNFEELVVTLAVLSGLPAGDVERMLTEDSNDRLFIVLKALSLEWETVREIVLSTSVGTLASARLDQLRLMYQAISTDAARRTLRFQLLRAKARNGSVSPFQGWRAPELSGSVGPMAKIAPRSQ
jgi:uncharacterized protein (DUF2336 family)